MKSIFEILIFALTLAACAAINDLNLELLIVIVLVVIALIALKNNINI